MPVLNWIGKPAVVKHHKEVPFRLIEPVAELSLSEPPALAGGQFDTSENLIIEGDNLHALKALLPRYAGQVKCIYIDPPYNTGNEGWAYNDNVKSPEILKWLGEVVGKEGETLDRHDRWLCMMYPRLLLLKQFLREDGAIFVSIDDNEVATLRLLMDEIFGVGNFTALFIWEKRTTRENRKVFSVSHDYLMCFGKKKEFFEATRGELKITDAVMKRYKNPDNDPRGPWQSISLNAQAGHGTAEQFYTITLPGGKKLDPPRGRCWVVTARRLEELIRDNRIWFGLSGNNAPRVKKFLSETERGLTPHTLWTSGEVGTTDHATKMVSSILGDSATFETPKTVPLLQRILQIATDKDSLILDSFAGSGTTGHAVLKQNAEDGGNRKFILVEMDPKIAKDVTAERVRRVAQGYTKANGDSVTGLGGGFQYCRLSAEPLFVAAGAIRKDVTFAQLAEFVWFMECGSGRGSGEASPFDVRKSSFSDDTSASYEALPLDVRKSSAFPNDAPNDSGGYAADPSGGAAAENFLSRDGEAQLRRTSSGTAARTGQSAGPSNWPSAHASGSDSTAYLGTYKNRVVFLLYNGILKDRSDTGGNVLNSTTLEYINSLVPEGFDGEKIIYAARSRFDRSKLAKLGITFHQLPYDLATKTWF